MNIRTLSMTPKAIAKRRERATQRQRDGWQPKVQPPAMTRLDHGRRERARAHGWALPPLERDCPAKPTDGRCDCCAQRIGVTRLHLDHDRRTGAFRGWNCHSCCILGSDRDRLQTRLDYLNGNLPTQ
jgi:hypothetical protein